LYRKSDFPLRPFLGAEQPIKIKYTGIFQPNCRQPCQAHSYVPSLVKCSFVMSRNSILSCCRFGFSTYASNLFGPGAHFRCCRVIQITNPRKMKESDVFFGSGVGVCAWAYSSARPRFQTSHRPEPIVRKFHTLRDCFHFFLSFRVKP
jgi:hypothetical protein